MNSGIWKIEFLSYVFIYIARYALFFVALVAIRIKTQYFSDFLYGHHLSKQILVPQLLESINNIYKKLIEFLPATSHHREQKYREILQMRFHQ